MKRKIPMLFACAVGALLAAGFETGKTAFTKHYQTALLKDPQPLADTVATLPLATGVKITAIQGKWANVSAETNSGWVYLGNLSENKPAEDHSIRGLRVSASETTASVAGRALDNVTKQFAEQEGLQQAIADLQWLETQSDKVDDKAVAEYLKANRKGEYQ